MEKVFEDEFMDLQTALISLCLEVTEEKVNKVYLEFPQNVILK